MSRSMPDAAVALRAVPLLRGVSSGGALRLARSGALVEHPAGSTLFRMGEPADCMYVVLGGRLHVRDQGGHLLRVLHRGDAVGELALLTEQPRSASASAVRDTVVLQVPRSAFLRLLHDEPALSVTLLRRLAEQLVSPLTEKPAVAADVVAVVELDPEPHDLAEEIASGASVTLLRGDGPASQWSQDVEQAERRGQVLLSCRLAAPDPWRSFVLRTADRVLVAGSAAARADSRLRGCDTVAVRLHHRSPWPVWAAALQPRSRQRLEDPACTGVLARRMLGSSPGAVLSGGGARGMAHVGVLAALEQSGLRPERWGGCSMGAFVAALIADGRGADEVTAICREELVRRHPFRDLALPRHALSRGRRLREMLARVFGDQRVEDLREDFFCVTADLLSGTLVVHREGLLREVVAASMAIPGLAPPVRRAGGLLVDGGVLDNLPVGVMAATREGPVMAVDVMRRSSSALSEGTPSLFDTVCQSLTIGGRRRLTNNLALADAVLAPVLGSTGLLDFDRLDESIQTGRAAVLEALPALRALCSPS